MPSAPVRPSQSTAFDRFFALGLSCETAARFVGVSPTTFDGLVADGIMPSPRRIRKRKLWDRRELEAAFEHLPREDRETDAQNPWDEKAA